MANNPRCGFSHRLLCTKNRVNRGKNSTRAKIARKAKKGSKKIQRHQNQKSRGSHNKTLTRCHVCAYVYIYICVEVCIFEYTCVCKQPTFPIQVVSARNFFCNATYSRSCFPPRKNRYGFCGAGLVWQLRCVACKFFTLFKSANLYTKQKEKIGKSYTHTYTRVSV